MSIPQKMSLSDGARSVSFSLGDQKGLGRKTTMSENDPKDQDLHRQVALYRYQVISAYLALEPKRGQKRPLLGRTRWRADPSGCRDHPHLGAALSQARPVWPRGQSPIAARHFGAHTRA